MGGSILWCDNKAGNGRLRRSWPNGTVVTVAGPGSWAGYFVGQQGSVLQYTTVMDVKADPVQGNIAVTDVGANLNTVMSSGGGILPTFMGRDDRSWGVGTSGTVMSGWATSPPTALAADGLGGFYIAMSGVPYLSYLARLDVGGLGYIIGGGYNCTTCGGDGGLALSATFGAVQGMVRNATNNALFFSETNVVRRIDLATGVVTRYGGICGNGTASGDCGAAIASTLAAPSGLAFDYFGNLLVVEFAGHRVRSISSSTGIITTLAGTGVAGYTSGVAASLAMLRNPFGIAVDPLCGTVFVGDSWNAVIRRFPANGSTISVAVGVPGVTGFGGDGGAANASYLSSPRGLDIDAYGRLFIADSGFGRVRVVQPGGTGPCPPPSSPTAAASPSTTTLPSPSASRAPTASPAPSISAASSSPTLSAPPSASATPSAYPSACPAGTTAAPLVVFPATTGSLLSFTPPRGLAAVYASLWGGGGSSGQGVSAPGGGGAYVAGWLSPQALALLTAPGAPPMLVMAGDGGCLRCPRMRPCHWVGRLLRAPTHFIPRAVGVGAGQAPLACGGGCPLLWLGRGGRGGKSVEELAQHGMAQCPTPHAKFG